LSGHDGRLVGRKKKRFDLPVIRGTIDPRQGDYGHEHEAETGEGFI
jgi:hypothetical protein